MKKKIINDINKRFESKSYDDIASKIDLEQYNKKEKHKSKKIWLSLACGLGCVILVLISTFIGNTIYCNNYNAKVINRLNELLDVDKVNELYKVKSIDDISKLNCNNYVTIEPFYKDIAYETDVKVSSKNEYEVSAGQEKEPTSSDKNNNSYETNVQVNGIDEADVAKCDGEYIYVLGSYLKIYNLKGEVVTQEKVEQDEYDSMYIHKDEIILTGRRKSSIYQFALNKLYLKSSFSYERYSDSRIVGDTLYLINRKGREEKDVKGSYYDGFSASYYVYSIIKYDLKTNTYEEVKNLNSGNVKLYMSSSYIFLSTEVIIPFDYRRGFSTISVISVFDYDLQPIAALKVNGRILNQFSMDEYNNYLRVVTYHACNEKGKINALTIFDLKELKKVGYLNEGIGIDYQVVKSVRFDQDTCYVVTYETKDPLYEIDVKDVTRPEIVSIYKAPGYSAYLHNFTLNGEKYLFGIGVLDDLSSMKVSVYKDNEDGETTQIGKDFVFSANKYYYEYPGTDEYDEITSDSLCYEAMKNHKALFIHNDGQDLYIGFKATKNDYYVLKIDVTQEENVISIYKKIELKDEYYNNRGFLVDGMFYITSYKDIYLEEF